MTREQIRCGFVGLIGQPNAGKSSLLNALVEEKVSIVTAKPQTTRRRVLGVVNRPGAQVVFVDAPGVLKAEAGLNSFLQKEAEDVIQSSDALIAVLSLDERKSEDVQRILDLVQKSAKPFLVVVTKMDLQEKVHRLIKIQEMVRNVNPAADVVDWSQNWGQAGKEQLDKIVQLASELLPLSPAPLFDTEIFTPHTVRELAAEMIREQCFEILSQELPYNLAIRIVKFDETKPKLTEIYADIVVGKTGHKTIVVGKKAETVKKIGMAARTQLEKMIGNKVFLKLEVVVRENWSTNKSLMKDLGYAIKSD